MNVWWKETTAVTGTNAAPFLTVTYSSANYGSSRDERDEIEEDIDQLRRSFDAIDSETRATRLQEQLRRIERSRALQAHEIREAIKKLTKALGQQLDFRQAGRPSPSWVACREPPQRHRTTKDPLRHHRLRAFRRKPRRPGVGSGRVSRT